MDGRTDRWTDGGYNNIPCAFLKSVGIHIIVLGSNVKKVTYVTSEYRLKTFIFNVYTECMKISTFENVPQSQF